MFLLRCLPLGKPNDKIKSLLQLLGQIGMCDMKHFLHKSQSALREIFLTLGKTVQDTFLSKLKQAAHFGLLVDDLTDISGTEQMVSLHSSITNPAEHSRLVSCLLTTFWKIQHRQMQVPSLTALSKPWISSV